jgi:ArsR family transcriptional regulator
MPALPTPWTNSIAWPADDLAARLKILANEDRLRILGILWRSHTPLFQYEVVTYLGRLGQPTVSHHLRLLVAAGLVTRTPNRSRRTVAYALNRDGIDRLAAVLELPPVVGTP